MLSCDPVWMFPLIKYLLKIKTKTPSSNSDHLKVINERISKAIMGNRVHTRSSYDICSYTCTCMWWKTTNNICTHKSSSRCTLSKEEIRDLNCFFGQLCVCTDNDYEQPEPVPIPTDAEAPFLLISELQVWRSLVNLKKTATGPDQIPFWIWKDLAGILTPAVTKIWNNPHMASFMEEIINPIPKDEIPKENGDFRGINITHL